MADVIVLASLETKSAEAAYLVDQIEARGLSTAITDISLRAGGAVLNGEDKQNAMETTATRALRAVLASPADAVKAVVGLGGGTGGEIALRVLGGLPSRMPKVLLSTMPFDPRAAVADNSIVLVPALCDLAGLNPLLRETLSQTAMIVAGLCLGGGASVATALSPSVAITALGATDGAVAPLVSALDAMGRESTVFHANGFGGAAFSRFAGDGAFSAIVDLTPHELTRIHVAGAHVPMPDRFSAGDGLPRIVLPGALNFIGLGELASISPAHRNRPHYQHSGFFTHVKLSEDEMARVATRLAQSLNALSGPCAVVVPMGGFSHHDRPGGAIEDPALRAVCLTTLRAELAPQIRLRPLDAHLFDPDVTSTILTELSDMTPRKDP